MLILLGGGVPDHVDAVGEPGEGKVDELLVEEGDTELAREQRNVLDDRKAHAPLLVLGELHDRGEKRPEERVVF